MGFALAGGTYFSLRYRHRQLINLDFFATIALTIEELINKLQFYGFPLQETFYTNSPGVFGYLEGVKVDFVRHDQFPMIRAIEEIDGIRLFGDDDLMAMKAAAILRRSVKKDF